jgi:hypothetical protein
LASSCGASDRYGDEGTIFHISQTSKGAKNMKSILAVVILLSMTGPATAGNLLAIVNQDSTNVPTFDPSTFMPGLNVDVYEVVVFNPNDDDATALEIALFGDFVNQGVPSIAFRRHDSDRLPWLGLNLVADTFFILPSGADFPLAVDIVDTNAQLSASWTVAGDVALAPAAGSAIVANISVPTGVPIDMSNWSGRAVVDGRFEEIRFIPEPTSALIAGLALVSFVMRRK